jgi:hypothetical protein
MQRLNFWNKLHLHGYKVIVLAVLMVAAGTNAVAQKRRWVEKNNPNYDERKLTYGFLIGIHSSTYQINYSDAFVTPDLDNIHSVTPKWKYGFSIGFITNYRINDQLDFRITPKVAFYEHELKYAYLDGSADKIKLVETTVVELPVLLKYKSERRGNVRMYMIGGLKPGVEASGQKESKSATVRVKTSNLSLEAGFGFDLYYPLFKFSPEIRFSHGLVNLLDNKTNEFGAPLDRVNTNTISIYFLFQ